MATTEQRTDAVMDDVNAALESAPQGSLVGVAQATAKAAVNAVPDEEKAGVAQAAAKAAVDAAPAGEKAGVAQAAAEAAVGAVAEVEERAAVVQGVVSSVPKEERAAVVQTAIEAVPQGDLKAVAQAAVEGLTAKDRRDLRQEAFPQDSDDRKMVFLVGFVVSGLVVVSLSWIATGADHESTSTAILLLGTAFTSAMLGGLLGAYKGG